MTMSAQEMVRTLNELFGSFDRLAEVSKINLWVSLSFGEKGDGQCITVVYSMRLENTLLQL